MSVYRDGKEIFYDTYHYKFTENIGANWYLVKKDFVHDILYEAAYWYFDFDGDGMPELIFDLPGAKERPYILKYDSEKKNAYVFLTGDSSFWHFMGPGKLCYYNTSKKTAIRYGIANFRDCLKIKVNWGTYSWSSNDAIMSVNTGSGIIMKRIWEIYLMRAAG